MFTNMVEIVDHDEFGVYESYNVDEDIDILNEINDIADNMDYLDNVKDIISKHGSSKDMIKFLCDMKHFESILSLSKEDINNLNDEELINLLDKTLNHADESFILNVLANQGRVFGKSIFSSVIFIGGMIFSAMTINLVNRITDKIVEKNKAIDEKMDNFANFTARLTSGTPSKEALEDLKSFKWNNKEFFWDTERAETIKIKLPDANELLKSFTIAKKVFSFLSTITNFKEVKNQTDYKAVFDKLNGKVKEFDSLYGVRLKYSRYIPTVKESSRYGLKIKNKPPAELGYTPAVINRIYKNISDIHTLNKAFMKDMEKLDNKLESTSPKDVTRQQLEAIRWHAKISQLVIRVQMKLLLRVIFVNINLPIIYINRILDQCVRG